MKSFPPVQSLHALVIVPLYLSCRIQLGHCKAFPFPGWIIPILLTGEVLHTSNQFSSPSLGSQKKVNALPVLGIPRGSHQRPESRDKTTSLSLLVMLLLMQSRTFLAPWKASTLFRVISILSLTSTPKSFLAGLRK